MTDRNTRRVADENRQLRAQIDTQAEKIQTLNRRDLQAQRRIRAQDATILHLNGVAEALRGELHGVNGKLQAHRAEARLRHAQEGAN